MNIETLTAYHEAGHVVMAFISKQPGFGYDYVTIKPNKNFEGRCHARVNPFLLYSADNYSYTKRKTRVEWICRVKAAGQLAEIIYLNKQGIIPEEIESFDLFSDEDDFISSHSIFKQFFKRKSETKFFMDIEKTTHKKLLQYWPRVETIAQALLKKKKLYNIDLYNLWYGE